MIQKKSLAEFSNSDSIENEKFYDYGENAKIYCKIYESIDFEQAHATILDILPTAPCDVLDVGAGSGRDAAALIRKGYRVTAVEPSKEMRKEGKRFHSDDNIKWVNDSLPRLDLIRNLGKQFCLILVSAVWMHIDCMDRNAAFKNIVYCLQPNGLLVLTLRQGPEIPEKHIFAVSRDEVLKLGNNHNLQLIRNIETPDLFGRTEITWATVVFRRLFEGPRR